MFRLREDITSLLALHQGTTHTFSSIDHGDRLTRVRPGVYSRNGVEFQIEDRYMVAVVPFYRGGRWAENDNLPYIPE